MLEQQKPDDYYLKLKNADLDEDKYIRNGFLIGFNIFTWPTVIAELLNKLPTLPIDTQHVAGVFAAAAAIVATPALIGKFLKDRERHKALNPKELLQSKLIIATANDSKNIHLLLDLKHEMYKLRSNMGYCAPKLPKPPRPAIAGIGHQV